MRRVLAPGGRVFVLEMNFPRGRFGQGFFAFYLNRLLPRVARLFSGNPAAYHYLADSILHFPGPRDFMNLMEAAGFHNPERRSLTFGITSLYIASRPDSVGKTASLTRRDRKADAAPERMKGHSIFTIMSSFCNNGLLAIP